MANFTIENLILLRDENYLWINKPPGLVVHPTLDKFRPNLEKLVQDYLGGKHYLTLPHRLDKDTSGVVLFCLTPQANQVVQAMFQNHQDKKLRKAYWGITHKCHLSAKGIWEDFLKSSRQRGKEKVEVVKSGGKKAITHYRILETFTDSLLIEFEIHTGRMHQIRVQTMARGCGLVGDQLYRDEKGQLKAPRQLLHARLLEFFDPLSQTKKTVEAPLPQDMADWVAIRSKS